MKKHTYKKSSLVLLLFYRMLNGKELVVSDLEKNLHVSNSTLYSILLDIDLFIGEFHLDSELELIKIKKNIN